MDHCDECGFVYAEHDEESVAAEILGIGPRYATVLNADRTDLLETVRLTKRVDPDVWSAAEYACHVRDMLLSQRERLYLALVVDQPSFVPMYRDQRVVLARYGDESPEQIAAEICFAARLAAWAFQGLDASSWRRTCTYNYPEPATRTLLWLAQHTLHEGEHHLLDIMRLIESSAS